VHQAAVAEVREFRVPDDSRRAPLVLATAPGLGRPRPQRPGEAQGAMVYESDERTLAATTHAWDGQRFAAVARREFARQ
jgi:hypothetical protein